MKKHTTALIGALAFALSATPALAGPHAEEPGTPGEKNCVGHTMAYLAQGGKELGFPGVGNVARASGVSVKEAHAVAEGFCADSGE